MNVRRNVSRSVGRSLGPVLTDALLKVISNSICCVAGLGVTSTLALRASTRMEAPPDVPACRVSKWTKVSAAGVMRTVESFDVLGSHLKFGLSDSTCLVPFASSNA